MTTPPHIVREQLKTQRAQVILDQAILAQAESDAFLPWSPATSRDPESIRAAWDRLADQA